MPVQVINLEPMMAKCGHPFQYLRDLHPRIFQNSQIFYLFLSTWYPQQILQNIQCIVQVVDLEPLVAKFGHPSQYLRDNIHPHMFLNMEIFNIYLNILRDHGHFAPQAQSM